MLNTDQQTSRLVRLTHFDFKGDIHDARLLWNRITRDYFFTHHIDFLDAYMDMASLREAFNYKLPRVGHYAVLTGRHAL